MTLPPAPDRHEAAGLPRLVIFDVDGTLQDTLAWWPDIVPRCVRAFAARIGVDLPIPAAETAVHLVGKADAEIWGALLPAAFRDRWRELRDVFVPLEVAILTRGDDYLFPGTRELLAYLRAAGVRVALASNCRRDYFTAVLEGQGLGGLVDEAYCLDSPGVSTKRDMVRLALASAGTRDAAMVGDRDTDAEAAAAHGVPFIHRTGFLAAGALPAEACAGSQAEILDCLRGRAACLRALEAQLDGARRVGVTGPFGVGKSLFAARLAALRGEPVMATDHFLRRRRGPPADGDHLAHAFDLPALERELALGTAGVVEGLFLEDPRLRSCFDRIVHLRAMAPALEDRVRRCHGEAAATALRECYLPAWQGFAPHRRPDAGRIVVELDRLLFPALGVHGGTATGPA